MECAKWSYYEHVAQHIYPKYSEGQLWANSVDPDHTTQNTASDQGLHYLPFISKFTSSKEMVIQFLAII